MTSTPGSDHVAPIPDPLRVALADEEDDCRGVGRGIVWQALLPIGRDQLAFLVQRIDVIGERERDDIGGKTVDHRARLLARTAMRLADAHPFAGFRLPLPRESGVDLRVEFPRRIIGDIEQGLRCLCEHGDAQNEERRGHKTE